MKVQLRAADDDGDFKITLPPPKADKAQLRAWMTDFLKEAHPFPFGRNMYLHHKYTDIVIELYPNNSHGHIHFAAIINTGERHAGHPTKVIQWMMDLCDKHGVELDGVVEPIKNTRPKDGNRALTAAELKRWYKKLGFTINKYGDLSYKPGSRPKP